MNEKFESTFVYRYLVDIFFHENSQIVVEKMSSSDDSDDSNDFVSSEITLNWEQFFEREYFGDDFPNHLKKQNDKQNENVPAEISTGDLTTILQTIRTKTKKNRTRWSNFENGNGTQQHANNQNHVYEPAQKAINTLLGIKNVTATNAQDAQLPPPQNNQPNNVSNLIGFLFE